MQKVKFHVQNKIEKLSRSKIMISSKASVLTNKFYPLLLGFVPCDIRRCSMY